MLNNKIQKEILSICSFFPKGATYTDLKPKKTNLENDLYNYHLQHLVKNNYLEKKSGLYHLTNIGKSLVTNIDHETIAIATNYKVSTYLCPVVEGRVLLYKRLKHPQYGYTGFISEKLKYGETILSAAKRGLKEETNLTSDFRIIGNMRQIRRNSGDEVIEDGIFYVCYTDKVKGKLTESSREGEYFWVDLDKVSTIEKIFKPSLEIGILEIQKRLSGIVPWDSNFIYELEPEPEEY